MTPTAASLLLAWVTISVLLLAIVGILRRLRALERAVAGGQPLAGGVGRGRELPVLAEEAAVDGISDSLLLFATDSCPACSEILRSLLDYPAEVLRRVVVVLASGGVDDPMTIPGVRMVSGDTAREWFDACGVSAVPFAVKVDRSRRGTQMGLLTSTAVLDAYMSASSSHASGMPVETQGG